MPLQKIQKHNDMSGPASSQIRHLFKGFYMAKEMGFKSQSFKKLKCQWMATFKKRLNNVSDSLSLYPVGHSANGWSFMVQILLVVATKTRFKFDCIIFLPIESNMIHTTLSFFCDTTYCRKRCEPNFCTIKFSEFTIVIFEMLELKSSLDCLFEQKMHDSRTVW